MKQTMKTQTYKIRIFSIGELHVFPVIEFNLKAMKRFPVIQGRLHFINNFKK